MVKETKRKAFNFFRSYYDVYNELSDKDKVAFMDALLDRQFLGIRPEGLKGMANFAYISQTNSIDAQVKGYEDKTGKILTPTDGGSQAPTDGGIVTPTVQEEVEGQEEEEVEGQEEGKAADWIYKTPIEIIEPLYRSIYKVFPDTFKPKEKRNEIWCETLDKLIRIDKKEPDEILQVVNWIFNDDFWKTKVQSISYLRKSSKQDPSIKYYDVFNENRKAKPNGTSRNRDINAATHFTPVTEKTIDDWNSIGKS